MATLNALNKAQILDQDGKALVTGFAVTSSDPAVVAVGKPSGTSPWYATGLTAGNATVTATRTLDGSVAALDIEVLAAVPFAISLGPESPA